ncbi:tryptophan synthase subunit alpha [Enemella sp. A6]|uniref:tryptophan synthase subunit alpha n=1 Tax=Enemella sp. A6 TaxID=3440152 RepID=UPI003EB8F569
MTGADITLTREPGKSGRAIAAAKAEGRAAFIGYLPVGYPTVELSVAAMTMLARGQHSAGADIVEIGIPYSDPMLDGPVIQRAGNDALRGGVRTRDVFTAAEAVATAGAVPVTMTYWNLVEQYGVDAFARDFANAGGAGLITPDLTPDEAEEWLAASEKYDLERIFLVAPSSTDERIISTVEHCRGWVYATAVMGVTGTRTSTSAAGEELVARLRALTPDVLVGLGLGVSDGDQAATVAGYADAVIVGSALVKTLLAAVDAGNPGDLSAMAAVVDDLAEGVRRKH